MWHLALQMIPRYFPSVQLALAMGLQPCSKHSQNFVLWMNKGNKFFFPLLSLMIFPHSIGYSPFIFGMTGGGRRKDGIVLWVIYLILLMEVPAFCLHLQVRFPSKWWETEQHCRMLCLMVGGAYFLLLWMFLHQMAFKVLKKTQIQL